jgi:hypothetical protein
VPSAVGLGQGQCGVSQRAAPKQCGGLCARTKLWTRTLWPVARRLPWWLASRITAAFRLPVRRSWEIEAEVGQARVVPRYTRRHGDSDARQPPPRKSATLPPSTNLVNCYARTPSRANKQLLIHRLKFKPGTRHISFRIHIAMSMLRFI